ncbi:hypothetical protein D3C81_1173080 [compost metagenome]
MAATGVALLSSRPATWASSAMLWRSKICRGDSWMPRLRAREMICRLRIESPPSSKKLSWRPTRGTSSNSCQIAANSLSTPGSGAS